MTDISSHRPALDLKGSRVETWYVAEPMRVFHDYSGTLRTHLIVNSFCQREDYHISETTTTIKWCFTRVKVVSTYFTADSINRCDKKTWNCKYVGIGYLLSLLKPCAQKFSDRCWEITRWRNHKRGMGIDPFQRHLYGSPFPDKARDYLSGLTFWNISRAWIGRSLWSSSSRDLTQSIGWYPIVL